MAKLRIGICSSQLIFRNLFINVQPKYFKTFYEFKSKYVMGYKSQKIHNFSTRELLNTTNNCLFSTDSNQILMILKKDLPCNLARTYPTLIINKNNHVFLYTILPPFAMKSLLTISYNRKLLQEITNFSYPLQKKTSYRVLCVVKQRSHLNF